MKKRKQTKKNKNQNQTKKTLHVESFICGNYYGKSERIFLILKKEKEHGASRHTIHATTLNAPNVVDTLHEQFDRTSHVE